MSALPMQLIAPDGTPLIRCTVWLGILMLLVMECAPFNTLPIFLLRYVKIIIFRLRLLRLHIRKLVINFRLCCEHVRYNLCVSHLFFRYLIQKGILHFKMLLQNVEVRPNFTRWLMVKNKLFNYFKMLNKFHSIKPNK